ncbi:MAG: peptidoglycan-binding domain-containing protein [Myxococcota bacterium]|jgi:peptidoglycan hydrolase-like protein with peptidoglycan-binding domain
MPVTNRVSSPSVSPAALRSSSPGASVLRRGSSGAEVRQLQQALKDRGYELAVDGRFGPNTEAAVRRFQAAQGLVVDGLAGPNTLGRLRALSPSSPAAPVDVMEPTPSRPVPAPPASPATPGLAPTTVQTRGGAVRIREDETASRLRARSPEHARLVDEMRAQGFFPVRTADGGYVFMTNPSYAADPDGRGVSSREAQAYAARNGLRLPTRAEADAFRAQAPVVVQFEAGPTPGTPGARSATEQQARIAARLREAGVPESGVAIAGATKVWALEPGQRPGLNGGVTNVSSGAGSRPTRRCTGPTTRTTRRPRSS